MAARSLQPYRLPWRQPPTTASGVPADRGGWLVRLSDGQHEGVGDAAPWESWGTEPAAACEAALLRWRATGEEPGDATPIARSAVRTAATALAAHRAGLPLAHLLAQREPHEALAATSHALTGAGPLEPQFEAAAAAGFRAVKVKISPATAAAVAALLDTGLHTALRLSVRLDANCSFATAGDDPLLDALHHPGLSFIEEPMPASRRADLFARLAAGHQRYAFDESMNALSLEQLLPFAPIATFVLKPAVLGGVAQTYDLARRLHAAGGQVLVTNFIESAVGRLAARHLSAAVECAAGGLSGGHATGHLLAADLFDLPDTPRWEVPRSPGLGLPASLWEKA
jgi:L-alanine-DL-glutamate epimerase-like enolase superfamily enzyme